MKTMQGYMLHPQSGSYVYQKIRLNKIVRTYFANDHLDSACTCHNIGMSTRIVNYFPHIDTVITTIFAEVHGASDQVAAWLNGLVVSAARHHINTHILLNLLFTWTQS